MKTLKSIQKNQEQLNSLLMEKWGFKKKLEEETGHTGKSCKEAHPDMSHEEWEAEEEKKDGGESEEE